MTGGRARPGEGSRRQGDDACPRSPAADGRQHSRTRATGCASRWRRRQPRRASSRAPRRIAASPAGGLRIINNIHGERTAFSENWPNNARHWLPMIDHPYDKATGEFIVTAPAHYQVVANGLLIEEIDLAGRRCGARTGSSRCRSRPGSTRSAWRASRPVTTRRRRACRSRSGCFRRTPRPASASSSSPAAARSTSSASRSAPMPTRSWRTCRPPASAAAPSTRR